MKKNNEYWCFFMEVIKEENKLYHILSKTYDTRKDAQSAYFQLCLINESLGQGLSVLAPVAIIPIDKVIEDFEIKYKGMLIRDEK